MAVVVAYFFRLDCWANDEKSILCVAQNWAMLKWIFMAQSQVLTNCKTKQRNLLNRAERERERERLIHCFKLKHNYNIMLSITRTNYYYCYYYGAHSHTTKNQIYSEDNTRFIWLGPSWNINIFVAPAHHRLFSFFCVSFALNFNH